MTVVHNINGSAERRRGRLATAGATFTAQLDASAAVITITGELDAANIHHFWEYVDRRLSAGRRIILDLSQLEFLAAQGIQMILEFDDQCHRHGVEWALVAGPSATRLLQICDSDGRLPSATSISGALEHFSGPVQMSLQLVAKPS